MSRNRLQFGHLSREHNTDIRLSLSIRSYVNLESLILKQFQVIRVIKLLFDEPVEEAEFFVSRLEVIT